MTPRTALLFPGQGSQFVGMGLALAESEPQARALFEAADELLGFSLTRVMWEGPESELTLTRNAQPALLLHSMAVFSVLRERIGPVAAAAGHSLGEFSAHVAAGTISLEDGLRAVRLRGEAMAAAGSARPGMMAAIIGMGEEEVIGLCREVAGEAEATLVPANFNAEGQVVVSGDRRAIELLIETGSARGVRRIIPLQVSGAFHSPLMEPAQEALRHCLDRVNFQPPRVPVLSNVTAAPALEPDQIRELLVRQVTAPVRWSATIAAMLEMGVEQFIEVGPGTVLAGLNRRNARDARTVSIGGPSEFEHLENG